MQLAQRRGLAWGLLMGLLGALAGCWSCGRFDPGRVCSDMADRAVRRAPAK